METDKLKYFCMIAETGSLTKAAELLNISHGGLSKAISSLEGELKVKLFQPHGRGLEITTEGKALYPKAVEVLRKLGDLQFDSKPKPNLSTRIGLSEVLAAGCSGLIAEEISGALQFNRTDAGEVEVDILNGSIDFGLAFVPRPVPEMEYLKIGQMVFAAFARKDLAERLPGAKIPFVGPSQELAANPLNYRNRDGWPHEIPRNLLFDTNSFAVALRMMVHGICANYMPAYIANMENDRLPPKLQIRELSHFKRARTERTVFLVKAKAAPETPAMKRASKVIRKLCRSSWPEMN